MRLVSCCLVLSAVGAWTASGEVTSAQLEAMSEEEVEAMSEDVRIATETKQEEEDTNKDEGAEDAAGAQSHTPGSWSYCTHTTCKLGEGDCDYNSHCAKGLVCGYNNCDPALGWPSGMDCCVRVHPFHRDYCKYQPCEYGEGDCDCHRECAPGLKCGVNNCRKMNKGSKWYIPWWGDCCTHCSSVWVGPPGMRTKVPAEQWDGNKEVAGPDRKLGKPSAVLESASVFNLPPLGSSDEIKLKCCRYQREKCEFFITVYHCKPCSEDHNGGLPAHLLSNGWDSGSCAPCFSLPGDMSGTTHAMTTFHRTLNPGEVEIIPLSKDAPHVAVFERTGIIVGPWCPQKVGPHPPGPGCTCIPALLPMPV